MFGKKKQPSPPFVLQVLTTEYLIEGTVEGDTLLYFPELDILDSPPLRLTSVHIQMTMPVDIPARACAQFMVMGDSAVALVPRIEVSRLAQYEAWKVPDIPLLGVFYFGPYVMQGTLMLLRDGFFEGEMSMFDVHIASQIPGTRWGELHALFALVNGRWLHGYEPS